MSGREPAWRLLAAELAASTEEDRGSGDRAASYLISPYGARMNRVLMVGSLGVAEPMGTGDAGPFVRSRLTDPTGSTIVTGGGFQPRALEQLRGFPGPRRAVVVGKAHVFRGRDGGIHPSVRAESLRPISEDEHRALCAEAIDQSHRRVDLVRRLAAPTPPTDEELRALGPPRRWIDAARLSRRRYPAVDPASLLPALREALRALGSIRPVPPPPPAPAPLPVPRAPPASVSARESVFLEILDEISGRSIDGHANLDDLLAGAGRRGIRDEEAEELLGRLEESGAVEEPIVGKVRRA